MRSGRAHKTSTDRLLVVARSHIHNALEELEIDDEEISEGMAVKSITNNTHHRVGRVDEETEAISVQGFTVTWQRKTFWDYFERVEEEDGEGKKEYDVDRIKIELQAAEKALRSAEIQVSNRGSIVGSSLGSLVDEDGFDEAENKRFQQQPTETRRFLLEYFTDGDANSHPDLQKRDEAGENTSQVRDSNRNRSKSVPDVLHTSPQGSSQAKFEPNLRKCRGMSIQELDDHFQKALKAPEIVELLERSNHLDFNAPAFASSTPVAQRGISVLGAHLLQRSGIMWHLGDEGRVSKYEDFQLACLRFMARLDVEYKADAVYHGAAHAVDVMATSEWLIRSKYLNSHLSTMEHFMGLIAAAVHDVGHPGKNNLFHSKTMHPLAITYNDQSILENMHIARCFEIMQNEADSNWFGFLEKSFHDRETDKPTDLQQYVRKGLIQSVLATDMNRHGLVMEGVKGKALELESDDVTDEEKDWSVDTKMMMLGAVLHVADISNPAKPTDIMLTWTHRLLTEFWQQGDEEQKLGLEISPLCERASGIKAVPKGQIGFISFVVQPSYQPFVSLIPEAKDAMDRLEQNKAFWQKKDEEQATYEQIFEKQLKEQVTSASFEVSVDGIQPFTRSYSE